MIGCYSYWLGTCSDVKQDGQLKQGAHGFWHGRINVFSQWTFEMIYTKILFSKLTHLLSQWSVEKSHWVHWTIETVAFRRKQKKRLFGPNWLRIVWGEYKICACCFRCVLSGRKDLSKIKRPSNWAGATKGPSVNTHVNCSDFLSALN